jgi:hypothetical protein
MSGIASLSICVPQHSDIRLYFTVYDPAAELVDISNASNIIVTVWTQADTPVLQFTKTLAATTVQINNDNQFNCLLTQTDTALDAGFYNIEAWIINSDDEEYPVGKGTLEIQDVIRGDS